MDVKVTARRKGLKGLAVVGAALVLLPLSRGTHLLVKPPTIPEGVIALPIDSPVKSCIGGPGEDQVAAVFRVANGERVWDVFPGLLDSPELNRADGELTIVVYRDGWPGVLFGAPGVPREGPEPGSVDMCVETVDGSPSIANDSFIVYGDVSTAGSLVADRVSR